MITHSPIPRLTTAIPPRGIGGSFRLGGARNCILAKSKIAHSPKSATLSAPSQPESVIPLLRRNMAACPRLSSIFSCSTGQFPYVAAETNCPHCRILDFILFKSSFYARAAKNPTVSIKTMDIRRKRNIFMRSSRRSRGRYPSKQT